jgi:putative metallohydrolase (TIGR04338 family)
VPSAKRNKDGSLRDTQRQRLYDAERAANLPLSKAAQKYLVDGSKVASTGNVSIEACQTYVDHVVTSAWFQSRWGVHRVRVDHKVSGSATGYRWSISLPPWGRCEWVILHELAHAVHAGNQDGDAAHGPEFAGIFLTLVRYQCGAGAAKDLRAALKKSRVRYSMIKVPQPNTKRVTPRTTIVSKQKQAAARAQQRDREERLAAAARQERQDLGSIGRKEAARVLRANVKSGVFGPAGSKPRTHALATARLLEKGSQR